MDPQTQLLAIMECLTSEEGPDGMPSENAQRAADSIMEGGDQMELLPPDAPIEELPKLLEPDA